MVKFFYSGYSWNTNFNVSFTMYLNIKFQLNRKHFMKYFSERNFSLSRAKNLIHWNTFSKETTSLAINYIFFALRNREEVIFKNGKQELKRIGKTYVKKKMGLR